MIKKECVISIAGDKSNKSKACEKFLYETLCNQKY